MEETLVTVKFIDYLQVTHTPEGVTIQNPYNQTELFINQDKRVVGRQLRKMADFLEHIEEEPAHHRDCTFCHE